ncbi:polyphosphate kinase 1 [Motiliproteus sediminis]|uniref:polyphosphate kinase 1 n=1 Tax=Motiliproteus sediminis TaxID=1468178 RepID=UPI001AEFB52B|nr:polyphosphate kinase 1 [Motiliproteus sediminis]
MVAASSIRSAEFVQDDKQIRCDYYIDKELSWLSFNERVLQEAADPEVPLVERMRFLGIYSNNLDEYFRVRVADVKRRVLFHRRHGGDPGANALLAEIENKVVALNDMFDQTHKSILKGLRRHNIHLIDETGIAPHQHDWAHTYFRHKVLPHITPIIVTDEVDLEAVLQDYATYLVLNIESTDGSIYAVVEIPTTDTPRFIQLPEKSKKRKTLILLDDLIRYCLDLLMGPFFEYQQLSAYSIKLTRDAEYDLNDEIDQSLIEKMSEVMKQRFHAEPVRIVYDQEMPETMLKFLKKQLKLTSYKSLLPGSRYRNFRDFINFPNVGRAYLENRPINALVSKGLSVSGNAFEAIRQGDVLLYYPYHRFNNFTELLRQAAFDPKVERIQLNIYRVAKNSRIIGYLLDAVRNGKKVSVMVELRARFDEEANMEWARTMTEAGIRVIVGIPSLKVHSKLCLITRREASGLNRYAHIGTGNFHEGTARVYTDFVLLTSNPKLTAEVEHVFEFIQHSYRQFAFNKLLVSPVNARQRLLEMIDREIQHAAKKRRAEIVIKVNNIDDVEVIQKLYDASQAGVKVRMIVRGMCSLVPGIKGVSDNIQAISIVDRFLEHPRVLWFHDNGKDQVFIGSGDLMKRNLDHRVEVHTPIIDERLKQQVIDILELQFKDRTKARIIDAQQQNRYVPRGNRKKLRSQMAIYDYLRAAEKP